MASVEIHTFEARWLMPCLALLDLLTPDYFAAEDRSEFERFLRKPPGPYFVLLAKECVVGCGGVVLEPGGLTATLCWGMVAPSWQRQGLGSRLTEHRTAVAETLGRHVRWLQVNTTQKADGFYAAQGFREVDRHKDAFGAGLDHVHMRRTL